MESVIEINFFNNDLFSVPGEEATAILTALASQ